MFLEEGKNLFPGKILPATFGYLVAMVTPSGQAPLIQVYPNPAYNNITIRLASVQSPSTLSLYDAQDKLVLSKKVNANVVAKQLNIANLSTGFYYIKWLNDKKQQVLKLVKQ